MTCSHCGKKVYVALKLPSNQTPIAYCRLCWAEKKQEENVHK